MSADKPRASACNEQALLEYLDGSLPVHRRTLVESHAERCEVCRRNLAGFEKTLAMTAAVPVPAMDAFVSSGFGARIRRRIGEYSGRRSWARRWSPAFSGAIAGAATVLLVLAASERLSLVEPERPAASSLSADHDGNESAGSSGLEEFLATVILLYEDEIYGGEVLVVAGPSDLDSEVSEYLLDTASEAELLEQMELLAEGEDLYALTGSEER